MLSSTGVPPRANIKEILPAKSWSKISQNQFKLVYSVWISDGQNYVFFTTFAKPKVVVYGSCTCPSQHQGNLTGQILVKNVTKSI